MGKLTNRQKIIFLLKESVDLKVPDIVTWVLGIKPVIYMRDDKKLIPLIKSLFPELNIERVLVKRPLKSPVVLLSKDSKALKQASSSLLACDNRTFGSFLGYPKCCIETHIAADRHGKRDAESLVTFRAIQKSKKLNFLLNNLLTFVTRVYEPKSISDYHNYHHSNREYFNLDLMTDDEGLSLIDLAFISHVPCSYDCKESLEIANKVNDWLIKNIPEIQVFLKQRLARPFLVFDTVNWLAFDGEVKGKHLRYKGIDFPYSPVKTKVKEYIKKGNRLLVEERGIKVYKGTKEIFSYKKKEEKDGYLADFSEK